MKFHLLATFLHEAKPHLIAVQENKNAKENRRNKVIVGTEKIG